jgi:hypothetical protein
MKISTIVKLGVMMLVMLISMGTVSASGGASYSTAEWIDVPDEDFDVWSGTCSSTGDWYKFDVNSGDDSYMDLQYIFTRYGGSMKLHDDYNGDIEAWVDSTHSDHTADLQPSPQPRVQITRGTVSSYQFLLGRNTLPP